MIRFRRTVTHILLSLMAAWIVTALTSESASASEPSVASEIASASEPASEPASESVSVGECSRPVTGTYSVELGGRSGRAEYLSPAAYSGWDFGVSGRWTKAMPFAPEHAMMAFDARAGYASLLNKAGTASVMAVDAWFSWELCWYTRLPYALTVSVGGGPFIEGGVSALLRNSNNPVDVTAKAGLLTGASLSWRSRIGHVPVLLEDRLSLPLAGVFFMPQYGETFYEIYLGNTAGLAHFGWPGNMAGIDNTISVTLDFGRTALTAGYRLVISTAAANSLNTKSILNAFVIGIVPHGLGMKRKPVSPEIRPF